LNSGRVELLDLPKLAAQLCNLESRTARSGKNSIDHAPGAHDDLANAAAGALLAASGDQPTQRDYFMAMTLSREDFLEWKAGRGPYRERERALQAQREAQREAERNRPGRAPHPPPPAACCAWSAVPTARRASPRSASRCAPRPRSPWVETPRA
jgi:hypothetical protein